MKTRKGGEQMNSSKLKGIRVEKGKTQKNMAELIGKSLVTYSKKERGEVEFSNEEMSIVAKALDLTSDQVNAIFFDDNLPKGGQRKWDAMPQKPVKTSASGVGKRPQNTTISSVAVKVLRNCSESLSRALQITSWATQRSSRWIRWC